MSVAEVAVCNGLHTQQALEAYLDDTATIGKVGFCVIKKEKIMKDTFIVYTSYLERFANLSDEQLGTLFRAMLEYQTSGVAPQINDMAVSFCFDVVKYDMDVNNDKYEKRCQQQRANVEKRWNKQKEGIPKDTNDTMVYHRIPPNTTCTKHTDNDSDSDNDSVSDSDSDTDSVNEKDTKKEEAIASKKEIVDALVAKWNSYGDRGRIPTIRSVSKDGKTWKSILARVQENGINTVVEVMDKVFASDYLRGFKTDWCAKFDWMMLPSNFEKIANGNYDNTSGVQKQSSVLSAWMERYGEA